MPVETAAECDAVASETAEAPGLVASESVGWLGMTGDWLFVTDGASVNVQRQSAVWHSGAWLVVEASVNAVAGVVVDASVTASLEHGPTEASVGGVTAGLGCVVGGATAAPVCAVGEETVRPACAVGEATAESVHAEGGVTAVLGCAVTASAVHAGYGVIAMLACSVGVATEELVCGGGVGIAAPAPADVVTAETDCLGGTTASGRTADKLDC